MSNKNSEPVESRGKEEHEDHNEHEHEHEHESENEEKGSHSSDEEVQKNKYDRDGKHPIIGLIVFTVLQFIALLFTVIATPISMFKLNDEWRDKVYPSLAGNSKSICVTAWGMKLGCNTASYYNRDFTHTFCERVRLDFKIVEAFCLMCIFFMFVGLIMGVLSILQKVGKGPTAAIGTTAMVFSIIPWGVLAGMYHQQPCCETTGWNTDVKVTTCVGDNTDVTVPIPPFGKMGSYGAGFGLLVTSWCLMVIAIIFAFIPF